MSKTSVFKVLRDQKERWVCALKDKMQCTVVEDKHRTLGYKEMAIYIPSSGGDRLSGETTCCQGHVLLKLPFCHRQLH